MFLKLFENTVGENRPPVEALNDEEEALVEDLIRTFAFDNFVSIITDAVRSSKRNKRQSRTSSTMTTSASCSVSAQKTTKNADQEAL